MKFVSYAQNFEDVMLWRALRHVENGFYIDIGAQDALVDSVSKAFHDRGWHGVHVEPVPAYANQLRSARPGDTVLQVALAGHDGTLTLNQIADTGLSTAVGAYADRHAAEHGFASQTIQVPALTMKSAFAFLAGRDVHWLKVDVEGFEGEVLKGWDSASLRPWVMVVEATVPNSQEPDHAQWEPIVLTAGYRFVYFDGLNRFYIADEHPELAAAFSAPPNVFDQAQLSGLASSELCRGVLAEHAQALANVEALYQAQLSQLCETRQAELASAAAEFAAQLRAAEESYRATLEQRDLARREEARAEAEKLCAGMSELEGARLAEERRLHAHIAWQETLIAEAQARAEELNQSSHHWFVTAQARQAHIDALYASASWRVAAPLRLGTRTLRSIVRLPRRGVRFAVRQVLARPALKRTTLGLLRMVPGLEVTLRRLALRSGLVVSPVIAAATPAMAAGGADNARLDQMLAQELSPRAARILAEIHEVIAKKAN